MDKYIKEFKENKKNQQELNGWHTDTKGLTLEEKIELVLKRNKEAVKC